MKIKLHVLHSLHRWIKVAVPATALGLQLAVPAAHAGQAGVFLSSDTYFTVQDVSLSGGTDAAYLQFGLNLHNGGGGDINMNDYGVKVSDASGHSFSAQLTARQSDLVASGNAATFRYSSQIPAKDTLDQLKVVVFRWDYSQPNLTDELGALPVAEAPVTAAVRQTVVQADEADSTLPSDAAVSFQAVRSFIVHQDEQSYLYTDVLAKNIGSTSFSLPAALKYRFAGTNTDSYAATIVSGTDTALLPGENRKVTVRAAVPSGLPNASAGYGLQFYSENNGGVSVLGSLDVAGVATQSVIGEAEPVFGQNGAKQLTVTVTGATTNEQSDGLHLSATVLVKNEGTDIASLPTLSGVFQFGSGGSAVSSSDTASHPLYLAAQESSTYRFDGVLPNGLKPEDVRLAILASVAGSSAKTSTNTSSTTSSTSSSSTATSSTPSTSTSTATSSTPSTSTSSGTSSGSSTTSGTVSSVAAVSTGGNAPIAVAVLAGATDGSNVFATATDYKIGDKLTLSGSSFSSDLDISLAEFHVNSEDEDGFRGAFAKFVITNHGKSGVTLPNFIAGLTASSGSSYTGSRQTSAAQTVMPGTSYAVNYSFALPSGLATDKLALSITDSRSAVAAADLAVVPQPNNTDFLDNVLHAYPFTITVNNLSPSWTYSSGTYTYKLELDAKVDRDPQVVVDANFSSLEFDLVDSLGRVQTTATVPFTGTGKLVTGVQTVSLGNLKELSDPMTVNVYETFATPDGTVKRLLKNFK